MSFQKQTKLSTLKTTTVHFQQFHQVATETNDLDMTVVEKTGNTHHRGNMPLEFKQLWRMFEH